MKDHTNYKEEIRLKLALEHYCKISKNDLKEKLTNNTAREESIFLNLDILNDELRSLAKEIYE